MLSRVFSSIVLLGFVVLQVSAHAAVAPALNAAKPARSDVKRPNTANPCGAGVNIASLFDNAQAVTATGTSFTATATNFNGGRDGSRSVTAKVDPTGTGKSFQAATVTKNGNGNPTGTGTDSISVDLPAQCTGGATKNKCLVQFVTTAGFGNCVVVQQGGGAGGAAAGGAGGAAAGGAGGAAASGAAAAGKNANANRTKAAGKGGAKRLRGGSRNARALVAEMEERGEELIQAAKRSVTSWIWA